MNTKMTVKEDSITKYHRQQQLLFHCLLKNKNHG